MGARRRPTLLTRSRARRFQKLMEKIVFVERETLRAPLRSPSFEHTMHYYFEPNHGDLLELLKDATVIIVNKMRLRADVLKRLPRLKLIAVVATGTDNIDLEFCRERGVEVR